MQIAVCYLKAWMRVFAHRPHQHGRLVVARHYIEKRYIKANRWTIFIYNLDTLKLLAAVLLIVW